MAIEKKRAVPPLGCAQAFFGSPPLGLAFQTVEREAQILSDLLHQLFLVRSEGTCTGVIDAEDSPRLASVENRNRH